MTKPDVVGASEAAGILEVEVPRLTRWRKSGKMPQPGANLKATPVWERALIERMARGEAVNGSKSLALASTKEAAEILGVDKSQIGRWRRAGSFPEPCLARRAKNKQGNFVPWKPGAGLVAGPLWWEKDILRFGGPPARERARRQKRESRVRQKA